MISWRAEEQHYFDVLHPVVLGKKINQQKWPSNTIVGFHLITVDQQTATCFDRQAVNFRL